MLAQETGIAIAWLALETDVDEATAMYLGGLHTDSTAVRQSEAHHTSLLCSLGTGLYHYILAFRSLFCKSSK
jgi:hypothetical protein